MISTVEQIAIRRLVVEAIQQLTEDRQSRLGPHFLRRVLSLKMASPAWLNDPFIQDLRKALGVHIVFINPRNMLMTIYNDIADKFDVPFKEDGHDWRHAIDMWIYELGQADVPADVMDGVDGLNEFASQLEFGAGYYDRGIMILCGIDDDADAKMKLRHELSHALVAQRYGLLDSSNYGFTPQAQYKNVSNDSKMELEASQLELAMAMKYGHVLKQSDSDKIYMMLNAGIIDDDGYKQSIDPAKRTFHPGYANKIYTANKQRIEDYAAELLTSYGIK